MATTKTGRGQQLALPTVDADPHRKPSPLTVRELEVRAQALTGHSVQQLAAALQCPVPADARRAKGFVGQLVERALGADPCAGDRPDFLELGVELKTIPVDARGWPAESTFCCSIHMASADAQRWETSRLRHRLMHVLWIPVQAAKVAPLPERRFGQPRLWQPSETQSAMLRADWEDLMGAIGAGGASALTAHQGHVLQVRPKAQDCSVRTLAPGSDGPSMVLPLGFYLRTSFTAAILRGETF